MPKKVLIVAYYWPPAGGPGVQRWLKFVKYLPEFDIVPTVIIPENPAYPIVDEDLKAGIGTATTIVQLPIREPLRWASTLSRKQSQNIASGLIPDENKQSFLQKAMLYIRGNFFIPDARIFWVRPTVRYLESYIEEHQFDTIITTGPPHSVHLIGLNLKKKFKNKLRWLADFRDPWTTISYHGKLRMGKRAQAKHKELEHKVLTTADEIIVTSPATQKDFITLTAKPVHLITNGYDDRAEAVVQNDASTFTIAHIGSLLSDRNPRVLWEVLRNCIDDDPDFKISFKLLLAGRVSKDALDTISNYALDDHLDFKGYVSHREAQELQAKATILLLIEADDDSGKSIIAGKVYEYLSASKPILAIGPKDGDVGTIIRKTETGTYAHYDQYNLVKTEILKQFEAFKNGDSAYTPNNIAAFHRKSLTKNLAEIITKRKA